MARRMNGHKRFPPIVSVCFVCLFGVAVALASCGPRLVDPVRISRPVPLLSPPREPSGRASTVPDSHGSEKFVSQTRESIQPTFSNFDTLPRKKASDAITLPPDRQPAVYHEVRPGETLSAIARNYRVSLQKLLQANGLSQSAVIQPGQLIYIP